MTEKVGNSLEQAATGYANNTILRAAVQAVPYVGGPLDTLLAGKGSKIQLARFEHLLQELSQRLENEQVTALMDEEEFFDIVMVAVDKAIHTRSNEKRVIYSNIVAKQVVEGGDIQDSEMALRIVADLEFVHLKVLNVVLHAPKCEGVFDSLPLVSLCVSPRENPPSAKDQILRLVEELPEYSISSMRYACAELVAKGLLLDESIGRWDGRPMEIFIATDTARWLEQWLLLRTP